MTNQIAPLSENDLHQIFPNYFGAPSVTKPAGSGSHNKIEGTTATDTGSISGWEGNDVITAGPAPNPSSSATIVDFGAADHGDDQLSGFPGDDVLVGGKGDNIIYGGAGNDYIYGDQLRLVRSEDDPTIPPNATPSPLFSSEDDGNDVLYGGRGDDFIHGGGGNVNFLRGGQGDGNDTLIGGGTGRDVLRGRDGDDYLIPGDTTPFTAMEGGNGADVFDLTNKTSGDVRILDFTAGDTTAVPPTTGDKIKLPPSDSIAVLYKMVLDEKTRGVGDMDWNWNWVATETDDGVTIPHDNGTLYLVGVEFADLTIDVSGGIFELTLT